MEKDGVKNKERSFVNEGEIDRLPQGMVGGLREIGRKQNFLELHDTWPL